MHVPLNIALLLGAAAFCVLATIYDVKMSVKGIKAGIAVEANYTWLYGTDKPTALQYYAVNLPFVVLACGASIAAYCLHNPAFYYGGLSGPAALGAKHIQGGLAWLKLGVKW